MKNNNIHIFFAGLVANLEFAGFAPKQKYTAWTETVRTAKSLPRKNQSESTDLPKTGFPYNKMIYFFMASLLNLNQCDFIKVIKYIFFIY